MGDDWGAIVELVERVTAEEDLMPSVVAGVRTMVQEVAVLPASDIAGHTRALLAAATRAVAARRGPTEAELSFVEELAVTRASQGIPIEVVLGAIHVSERAIWARTRERAEAEGLPAALLLDARELYDDWAEAVRGRLIRAHREARAGHGVEPRDRDADLVRRLLEGGSAAALAAAEAGLPAGGPLWVLVARRSDAAAVAAVERLRRDRTPSCSAPVAEAVVAITARRPAAPARTDGAIVGVAGPATADEVGATHRLAVAAVSAAEATGRGGLVHVAEVAGVAAALSRPDLAVVLVERHRDAWRDLDVHAVPVALAVRAWLEADRDTNATARTLFVHANTVRNRLQRFTQVTGIDPLATFGALDAWWLCHAWLADHE